MGVVEWQLTVVLCVDRRLIGEKCSGSALGCTGAPTHGRGLSAVQACVRVGIVCKYCAGERYVECCGGSTVLWRRPPNHTSRNL